MRKTWKKSKPSDKNIFTEMNKAIGLNNIKINNKITLTISKECHNHIKSLHTEYPKTEWLAVCKTQKIWEWHFKVVDMIHPWQKGVGAEVETTDEWMVWLNDYLIEKGEPLEDWNLVMHSHHTMGCFRSGTDDRARLGLNDGRELAWAVVSAYKMEWKTMKVDYKGCLNFYKPYNIEIDCEVDYEDDWAFEKVRKAYNEHEKWEEEIKARWLEIYSEQIKSDWINVDFSLIKDYLGLDIEDDLVRNYYMVSRLLPTANKDYFESVEKRAIAQAIEENPWKEIPSELLQRDDWDNFLLKQLEEARKPKVVVKDYSKAYESSIKPWGWETYEKKEETQEKAQEERAEIVGEVIWADDEYDAFFFNTERFPEQRMLRMEYNIPNYTEIYAMNWLRMVYDYRTNEDMTFGEYLEMLQQQADIDEWYDY